MQDVLQVDPARLGDRRRRGGSYLLGCQPAQIGEPQAGDLIGGDSVIGPFQGFHEAVDRVERHLGVVREVRAAVELSESLQAAVAKARADCSYGVEFHCIAKGIA